MKAIYNQYEAWVLEMEAGGEFFPCAEAQEAGQQDLDFPITAILSDLLSWRRVWRTDHRA